MKTGRRAFLGRVAAIAGAATLAGGKTAEAATEGSLTIGPSVTSLEPDGDNLVAYYDDGSIRVLAPKGTHMRVELPAEPVAAVSKVSSRNSNIAYRCEMGEAWCTQHLDENGAGHWHSINDMLAEARAEGYERAEFVKAKREESRVLPAPDGYAAWARMPNMLTGDLTVDKVNGRYVLVRADPATIWKP